VRYSDPIAYFLTWIGHGTRLHGDERGTVDRWHNRYGDPIRGADAVRHELASSTLRYPPYVLGDAARLVVEQAVRDHAAHRRWHIHALNVRTTHFHVVVTASRYTPELVMDQFKGWGTRRLRSNGLLEARRDPWASHGSTEYVWDDEGLWEVINYVLNRQ
jgi:REP element-mobilizing transposase RayT